MLHLSYSRFLHRPKAQGGVVQIKPDVCFGGLIGRSAGRKPGKKKNLVTRNVWPKKYGRTFSRPEVCSIPVTPPILVPRFNPPARQITPCGGSLRSTRGPAPHTPLKYQDSCGGHKPPFVCTALCMHRLVYAPHCLCTAKPPLVAARFARHGGQAPAPPLDNKTLAMAIDRLLCAQPCVCIALCMHRLVCAPPNHPLRRLASLDAGASPPHPP